MNTVNLSYYVNRQHHVLDVQELAGARERILMSGMEDFVRPWLPEQHSQFFSKQPLFYVGAKAADGRVWAGAFAGRPGFMSSPQPTSLRLEPLYLGHGGNVVIPLLSPVPNFPTHCIFPSTSQILLLMFWHLGSAWVASGSSSIPAVGTA